MSGSVGSFHCILMAGGANLCQGQFTSVGILFIVFLWQGELTYVRVSSLRLLDSFRCILMAGGANLCPGSVHVMFDSFHCILMAGGANLCQGQFTTSVGFFSLYSYGRGS